jgi:A118 family predicted phage portal protein
MNQKQAVEAISKLTGRDIVVSPMYGKINEWREWLEGNVKGFHEYYQKTNLSNNHFTKLKRHKTNMLLKGSEDWASILLNEKTQIIIEDEPSQRFVMGDDQISGVFGENDFWRCANENIATSRWSGTAAFEVFVRDMVVTEADGRLISGDGIGINYLSADQIIPVTYDNGIAREVAFISDLTRNGKTFQQVSFHYLEFGLYTILQFTIDDNGKVLPDSQSTIRTGSPMPWFSLIRKSGVNVHDYNSPLGVSIIDGNEDVLRGLDYAFDNFVTDFKLGRKMVLMNRSMFAQDDDGSLVSPQEAGAQLFINAGDKLLNGELYQEYNPSLRVQENSEALQKMLDMFSFKIGFGTKHYQFQGGTIQTATEYTGEKQDLVQNAAKEMICVEKALKEVTRAILWIGRNVLGVDCNPDAKITIIADDSYIIDQDSERKRWQEEIKAGIRQRYEYRMKFYGETEEEAKRNVKPTIAELLEGKAQGVVSDRELRQYLFPLESDEEAERALAEIKANEPTTEQLLGE